MTKEIFALAREHKLSTYDASYLDLAMKKGIPIATLDNSLISAANQSNVSIMLGNEDELMSNFYCRQEIAEPSASLDRRSRAAFD